MDMHELSPGVSESDLQEAHTLDEAMQDKYQVKYLTYWFSEPAQKAFCLVDAPDAEAAITVHREAHGLLADQIIEVQMDDVAGFMGAAISQTPAALPGGELDTAVRTILFTDIESSTALTQRLGDEASMDLIRFHDSVVRDALAAQRGQEIKHTGDGIMCSFVAASDAVQCAREIQLALGERAEREVAMPLRVRIGLSSGEPVAEHNDLFGASVQLARRVCDRAEPGQILVSAVVRELCIGKNLPFNSVGDQSFKGFDEPVPVFEVPWEPAS